MSGETGPLVGLKHEIRPSVLGGELQVRVQNTVSVCDESELRLAETCSAAVYAGGAVHLTSRESRPPGRIAHGSEGGVGMTQIICVRQRHSLWLSKAR